MIVKGKNKQMARDPPLLPDHSKDANKKLLQKILVYAFLGFIIEGCHQNIHHLLKPYRDFCKSEFGEYIAFILFSLRGGFKTKEVNFGIWPKLGGGQGRFGGPN